MNLINSSITSDKYYHISQAHYDVDLKNNYAPITKQLHDSLSTKNIHPLATYLDERPWYNNVVYTERTARELQEARKKRSKPLVRDMVRLNGNSNKFENNVIVGVNPMKTEQTKVGKETFKILEIPVQSSSKQLPSMVAEDNVETPKDTFEVKNMGVKRGGARFVGGERREHYTASKDDTYYDQIYIQSLESRLVAVLRYVERNQVYRPWMSNWKALETAMAKADFSFTRLDGSDKDIAFTIDKGRETKFRIRGIDNRYIPLNVYQYVMLHEAAHCANYNNWGHGVEFQNLLSLLCLAATELGFIRINAIGTSMYTTNGQPILSRGDIKSEVLHGVELIKNKNPRLAAHYDEFIAFITRQ